MTQIRPPETLPDVGRWLTEWAEQMEEHGQLAASLLRQLAAGIIPEAAPMDFAADFPPGYNEPKPAPGTLVENAVWRCDSAKYFPARDVADGYDHAGEQVWRTEPAEVVQCNMPAGHPAGEMHTGFKDDGTACYWVDEPVGSRFIPGAAPAAAWLDIAAVPAVEPVAEPWPSGPACAAPGPSGLLCIAVAAHDGPCWSPTQGSARMAWRTDAAGRPYPVSPALIGGDL